MKKSSKKILMLLLTSLVTVFIFLFLFSKDLKVNAYLSTTEWNNVISSSNWLPHSLLITNDTDNNSDIEIRIIRSDTGNEIVKTEMISRGQTIETDSIPIFNGNYTIQARTISKDGNYKISIN